MSLTYAERIPLLVCQPYRKAELRQSDSSMLVLVIWWFPTYWNTPSKREKEVHATWEVHKTSDAWESRNLEDSWIPFGFIKGMNKSWWQRLWSFLLPIPVELPASCVESSRVSVFLSWHLCLYGLFGNTGAFKPSLRSSSSLTLLIAIAVQTHQFTTLHFLFFFPLVFILLSYTTSLTTASPSLHSS